MASLASNARQWYQRHGTPWIHTTWRKIRNIQGDSVWLSDGTELKSPRLARGLEEVEAHTVVVGTFSAGAQVDEEIDRRWKEDRPDESLFLHAYAVAICEHLRASGARWLRDQVGKSGSTVLPHYSPGYEGWALSEQAALFSVCHEAEGSPIRVLPSGGLSPTRSTLAAFGITRQRIPGGNLKNFWNHQRLPSVANGRKLGTGESKTRHYSFPERALSKWSLERLSLTQHPGGRLDARFRFDGTTCSSLGRPFALNFDVELRADGAEGYRIIACTCEPVEGDTGHQAMCASRTRPGSFLNTLRAAPTLRGRLLEEAAHWSPTASPGACMCLRSDQNHKWSMVFQTLHHRLAVGPLKVEGN